MVGGHGPLRMVTDHYLRYILIRCIAYTSERTVAERIAAYTLITSSSIAPRLKRMADLGIVIDTMVQIVAEGEMRKEGLRPQTSEA
jgi:hypothetical protein